MATSDDEFPPNEDLEVEVSSGEASRPKKTLLGIGAIHRLTQPAPEPRTEEDYEAEATELAPRLLESLLEDIDVDLDLAFGIDRSSDQVTDPTAALVDEVHDTTELEVGDDGIADEFPEGDATAVSVGLEFPEDTLEARSEPNPGRFGVDALDLAEDSLPEPREGEPALDKQPADDRSWAKTDISATFGALPLNGDGELPPPVALDAERRPDDAATGEARGEGPHGGDQEFPGERTEMLASVFEQEPSVGKLVALDGPALGQEYFATGLRNSVGRGLNNSIVVEDLAMSRQHFEIFKNPDESYALRDLQSINGTLVNGTRVREVDLFHGDRIEAGKSTFQFVVTGNAPAVSRQRRVVPAATATMAGVTTSRPSAARAAPPTPSFGKVFLWASIVGMVLAVLVLAGVGFIYLGRESAAPAAAAAPRGSNVYLDGVGAVKARDWDRAQSTFEEARTLDPSLPGIDDQLRRIARERLAMANLEEGKALLVDGNVEEATRRIEKIPRDSVYHVEGNDLLRGARAARVDELFASAQNALDDENLDAARNQANNILRIVPTHHGARRLLDRIEALENPAIEEPGDAAIAGKARTPKGSDSSSNDFTFELIGDDDAPKKRSSKPQQGKPSADTSAGVPNFLAGFMLYRTGKFEEAEQFFDDAGAEDHAAASLARDMAGHIREFRANYQAGNEAMRAKDWSEADARLTAARRADSKIASGKGHFDAELRQNLAEAKGQRGLEALKADDARSARKYADEARVADASADAARKLHRELEDLARAKYVQAANLRKSDPNSAAKLCREIKAIVPSSSETFRKAEQLLADL